MIRISDFARISKVTIKTLRHYHALGLFSPAHTDPRTGYRYYAASQLPELHRILTYRALEFPLKQIRALLGKGQSFGEVQALVQARREDLARTISSQRLHLAQLDFLLQQMRREGSLPKHTIFLQRVEPRLVASRRARLASYSQMDALFSDLRARLRNSAEIEGEGAVWHRCAHADGWIDCEALVFVKSADRHPGCKVYTTPAATVASVMHKDDENDLPSHAAVLETLQSLGQRPLWPMREIYHPPAPGFPAGLVEMQLPLAPQRERTVPRRKAS